MNARQSTMAGVVAAMLVASVAYSATLPDTSELTQPPIERDTLKKDPESRYNRIWDQLKEGQQNGPAIGPAGRHGSPRR